MAREQRKLAAIVAADVVGYSRLMGRDESGTLARLRTNRSEHLDPILAKYGGRLVKLTGDGVLVEFASAVDALSAAIEFQQIMAEAKRGQSTDIALVFRIGLHLGDLIVEGDDLYGDGVNVAARLEGEAPSGGILISRSVRDAVSGRVKATFEDLGALSLKNIERPIRAFRVHWEALDWPTQAAPEVPGAPSVTLQSSPTPLTLPDKPSIAVLPFQNMSGDPEQEYFADGIVEDIITALSRTKQLFVIARNSSFTYKGRSVDIKQVGDELGVRYVLEGSVRKAGNRLRIAGQLIDATTGSHIWADRFEGCVEDLFDLQDQVTTRVVGAIEPELEQAEIDRARRKPTRDLQAYDYYLRGMASLYVQVREATSEALAFFHNAAHLDTTFALPLAQASLCYVQRKAYGWSVDHDQEMVEAERLARCALELNRKDPRVLASAGYSLAYVCGRLDEGADLIDQGVDLDPNYALAWTWRAYTKMWLGARKSVIEDYERALRLNPLDPFAFLAQAGMAQAHYLAGRYVDAVAWAAKSLHLRPHHLPTQRIYMASLGMLGRNVETRKAFEVYRQLDPTARILTIRERTPLRLEEDIERLVAGLRLAGLPE
ncbi:adenylate/guanylate cyclase domain-containing protein [Reyranella sp.]|uniref:adenylate/guanylate cyclase domain-containing protein n=1 Tax=Reyranella sp. TaxID=1929291 RepID=UPI0025EB5855|nr:adenylate/guanylate cyclase domain-containing protein [Reyranella sp.]